MSHEQREMHFNTGGGNIQGNGQAFSQGEINISGEVTNTINQLPDPPQSDQPGIKTLLTQLQTAIESEAKLSPKDKEKALKQVELLAQAGQNPQGKEKRKQADDALTMLKGIILGLPNATNAECANSPTAAPIPNPRKS